MSPKAAAAPATAPLAAALLTALSILAGLTGATAARAAIDPFYLDLLRDGTQSYDRGNFAVAAKQLRLACFGMLDEPTQLAACLTRLALARGAGGDLEAFRETFHRIIALEDRFGAYTRADLPLAVRSAFEQRALATMPAGVLEAIPSFRELLSRKAEAQVAALPPAERRRQLQDRLAKEPRSVAWNVLLAELDIEEGKTAAAVTRAEATAALAPQDPRALCVRGLARAATTNRCREAVADLEGCPLTAGDAADLRFATALLGCRVELMQWRQAEEQVRSLPAAFRQDRKVAALMREVAKKHPSVPATPPQAAGSGKSAGGAAAATPGSTRPADPPAGAGKGTGLMAGGKAAGRDAATPAGAGSTATGKATGAAGSTGAGSPTSSAGSTRAAATPSGSAASGAPASGTPASGAAASAGGSSAATAGSGPGATGSTGAGGTAKPGGATTGAGVGAAAGGDPPAPRPSSPLSAAEREAMARAEKLLTASSTPDLRESLRLARQVADAHPDSKEAQDLAGEAAYRNSRWSEAAAYFRRGGPVGDDHPELLFYMAVAFYEAGDLPAATTALKRALPNLQRTPFVESYVKRILAQ